MTDRQKLLLNFIKEAHKYQKRKYTGEPYWKHPLRVANIVSEYDRYGDYLFEIALCHDLLENNQCASSHLYNKLLSIGYANPIVIINPVEELTPYFTSDRFPGLNRKSRSIKESIRLQSAHYVSQTVKCADLIDNTKSIVEHDPEFAKVYLAEKKTSLEMMQNRNFELFIRACVVWREASIELQNKLVR